VRTGRRHHVIADDTDTDLHPEQAPQTPLVKEGEQRTVEIEDVGN
jgi:hypothetical protein